MTIRSVHTAKKAVTAPDEGNVHVFMAGRNQFSNGRNDGERIERESRREGGSHSALLWPVVVGEVEGDKS